MIRIKVPENYSFPDDADNGEPYSEMVTCRYDKDKGHVCIEKLAGHDVDADDAAPVDDGSAIQNSGGYADAVANAMKAQGATNPA